MRQRSSGLGLAVTPGTVLLTGECGARKHFDRYRPIEPGVVRPIYNPHPAAAQFSFDESVGKVLADHVLLRPRLW